MELFIGNIPPETSVTDLNQFFAGYGEVTHFRILESHKPDGRVFRFAHGVVEPEQEARRAMRELNGKHLDGNAVSVRPFAHRDPEQRGKQRRMPWGLRRRKGRDRRVDGHNVTSPDSWT